MTKEKVKNKKMDEDIIRVLQIGLGPNYGGSETLIKSLNDHLDNNIVFDFLSFRNIKIAYEDEYKNKGSKIYKILYSKTPQENIFAKIGRQLNDLKAQINFFKDNRHNFDVIHFNAYDLINIQIITVAKIFGADKIIIQAHNAALTTGTLLNKIRHKINMFITDFIVDEFVACSEDAAEFMFTKKRLENNNYRVIYNSIPLQNFKNDVNAREAIRQKYHLKNELVIGNVARLDPVKNQAFLLDIFKEILLKKPDAILMLIGDGKLKEQLINYSKDLKIVNNVKFIGMIDNVPEYLQALDVFVLPSLSEGFPLSLIEAQATGLPTIASQEGVPKETAVTDLLSFVSLKESPEFWADHITNKVEENFREDKIIELTDKGFDIKSYSRQFQSIYQEI